MDLGFSIQFSKGSGSTNKRVMVWLYPTDGAEALAPVALFDAQIDVPDVAESYTAEIYVSTCVNKLIEKMSNTVINGDGQAIAELMLALNERKIH
jgi:hypothetical protein